MKLNKSRTGETVMTREQKEAKVEMLLKRVYEAMKRLPIAKCGQVYATWCFRIARNSKNW